MPLVPAGVESASMYLPFRLPLKCPRYGIDFGAPLAAHAPLTCGRIGHSTVRAEWESDARADGHKSRL